MTTESKIRKFKEFHAKNPEVYQWFRYFILEMLDKKRRTSATMAYERARWEVFLHTDDESKYRMSNNYRPAYIRIFLKNHPHYKDMVEIRTSIFDTVYSI